MIELTAISLKILQRGADTMMVLKTLTSVCTLASVHTHITHTHTYMCVYVCVLYYMYPQTHAYVYIHKRACVRSHTDRL